jgi:hypothetical protein
LVKEYTTSWVKVGDIWILVGAIFEKDYICFFLLGMDNHLRRSP